MLKSQNIHKNVAEGSLHIVKFWLIPHCSNKMNEKKVSKKVVKMLWVPINGRTRVKTWSQHGFDRKTRETVVAGSFTIKIDLTRRIADLKKRKKKLKKS